MKRFFVAAAALFFVSSVSFGQDAPKLGYANTEYILSQLPEAKKVETELQAHGTQLENTLKAKAADFQKKMDDFQANSSKWVDAIVQDKQRELQELQAAFQKFQADAEASFTKKQQALMTPLYEKVGNAIAEVSKENGYAFIITLKAPSSAQDILLYKDPQYDISNLVLKKLGVTPTAAATPPPTKPQPK